MRKRIYIAGPISKGNLADNVNQATAAFVALAKLGYAPMCPHWSVYAKDCGAGLFHEDEGTNWESYCHVVGDAAGHPDMTHADWLGIDLPWVEVSHAVLRLPGESTGADIEVEHAKTNGLPVFRSIEEIERHRRAVWDWVPAGCLGDV